MLQITDFFSVRFCKKEVNVCLCFKTGKSEKLSLLHGGGAVVQDDTSLVCFVAGGLGFSSTMARYTEVG